MALEDQGTRRAKIRILFAHTDRSKIDRCIQELNRVGFSIRYEIVEDPAHISKSFNLSLFDLVVSEYSSSHGGQLPGVLARLAKELPLILLVDSISREESATLLLYGVTECVEMEAIVAVTVALVTVYDMAKSADRGMVIGDISLIEKTGGKSGRYFAG